jgi:beta-phosphoglucomutase
LSPSTNDLRYDAVIFDAGGTLIGFHEPEPFRDMLAQVGMPATDEDVQHFHRRFIDVIRANRDDAQGLGVDEGEIDDWWRGIFLETWPRRTDLAQEMFRWFRADRFDRVFSDVFPTLDALREHGMPMGVLSNFTTNLDHLLVRLGLRDYFDFVIVSARVGLAKPDPRMFDLAVSEAGRPRDRLLYVGDHVGDDIEGARGAGLHAVLVDRGDRHIQASSSRIASMLDLVPYISWPRRPAEAIIFDMDGVVLDSMPTHLLTWQRTLAPLGIDITAEDLYPLEGIPTELTAQILTEEFLGQRCSGEEAQRLAHTKRALFRDVFESAFVPGVVPLLHDLQGRGYRLGLVTGSARSVVDEALAPTGVAGLFDAIVTGDQVSQGKPHPEPYKKAASRIGVAASECLAVENAPLGVQSAVAAGMACVALETTMPEARLLGAHAVFRDAQALRAWLLSHWLEPLV